MKKVFLLLLLSLTLSSIDSSAQNQTIKDLYGKWNALEAEDVPIISFEFHEGGKLVVTDGGKKVKATYQVDFTKSPIWFDITVTFNGEKNVTLGILRFLDKDTFEWEMADGKKRLAAFSEKFGSSGFFRRVK